MDSKRSMTRRDFVKTAGSAAVAASLLPGARSEGATTPGRRRRYAVVGTGNRAIGMWGRNLVQEYGDVLELVGLCDINGKRVLAAQKAMGTSCPTFTSFDDMCDKTRPEILAVTTVDAFHAEYLVKALERGIDAVTEKPMVVDEVQCQAVLDAEKRTQRKIVVAHNYRYAPKFEKIRDVLASGEIGTVRSVDFNWYLDNRHGSDYFRRWHRLKSKGGSLWVHKASHHFDLVNWWLDSEPVEVAAHGDVAHYGAKGPFRHSHCRPCPHKTKCSYYWDMTKSRDAMELYAACEDVDGYHRDGCVFREDVDTYDTMSALVRYASGAMMTYSLNAYMPFEGCRVAFNGDKGRLEMRDWDRQPWPVTERVEMQLVRSFGKHEPIHVPHVRGGHWGGDPRLLDLIFRNAPMPPSLRLPESRAGAMACLTGIAARRSIEEKRPIRIADLVKFG